MSKKKKVTIDCAAEELHDHLRTYEWLVMVGVDEDSQILIVYSTDRKKAARHVLIREWKGYEIRIKESQRPMPA